MDYNIEFQVSSLCFILIFIYQFFSKKRLQNEQNRIYGILLLLTSITLLFDIGSVITIINMEKFPLLNLIFSKGYLCSMTCWVCTMLYYCLTINITENTGKINETFNHITRYLFFTFATIVLILILFTKLNFWHEGRLVYSYGIGTVALYCYAASGMIFVFLYTIINSKNVTLQKRLSLYIFSTLQGITAMIQFFYPSILLVSIGGALSIIFMYFSLENPDMALIEELNLQRQKAYSANQAKAEFLAHMSHEIRTPINAILGMDEIILRECTDSEITNYAFQIQNAGTSLLAIVNDILDFSKIESGKIEIVPLEYGTASLFHDLVVLTKLRAESKNLNLYTNISPEIPCKLFGDEIRIKQIITNFLSNAVKYTKKGSITMTATVEPAEENSVMLIIKVCDTGIGIRKEDIPKLFTSFERLDYKQNRHIEGTGLGMAISKQLATAMHGEITVESQYGKGSTFTVAIPQTVIDDTPIGNLEQRFKKVQKTQKKYVPSFTAENASVLVIDDNVVNIAVVSGLLKKTKVSITSATSGEECLAFVKKQHFDIIFMDHLMPDMDGVQTLAKMKAMPDNLCQTTPVIALTANAVSGAKEMYLSAGFTDYLSKPIDSAKLEGILREYLPEDLINVN